jgi:hypothetical protein
LTSPLHPLSQGEGAVGESVKVKRLPVLESLLKFDLKYVIDVTRLSVN